MFSNLSGQKVPNITFHTRQNNQWVRVTSQELFAKKTVVIFSLPGAFTPTCSSSHVPGYDELAPKLKENGVDDIICISVNDAFVMNEWARTQGANNIKFIPDGNGAFTAAMGLLVNWAHLGFGNRSWRYSMLVKDGIIKQMFIEPYEPGDPFKVSDAQTMLNYLTSSSTTTATTATTVTTTTVAAATTTQSKTFTLFTKDGCPYCIKAKSMLAQRGIAYDEVVVGRDIATSSLQAIAGATTVPQVFVNGKLIGGSEALEAYLAAN
ncbi:MAG TPA: glutathione peroxidase [Nostocaceae cyanobacterium]|nr:glutathione peroxidase [Nostocaceae cyanobacterium]